MEELTIGDIDALAIEGIDIKELLRTLRHVEAWDFLTPEHAQYRYEALTLGLQDIEERCRVSGDRPSPRSPLWAVPRPMVKERYLIHAFSGRRRPGDFQQFVDLARMQNEGTLIHTISVDIVVDPIWGDVSRPEVRAFWLTAVHDRMVVGAMAGPPCETWSQARGQPPTALPGAPARRAPRVIRDGDELWGRCSLALRELYQLDTGNLLLLFTLELLINLAVEGGIGGLEHPAPPNDETESQLPVVQYLLTWPEFKFIEIAQGLLGSAKQETYGSHAPQSQRDAASAPGPGRSPRTSRRPQRSG